MLNSIIEFSVRNKLIIGLFTIVLIILGTYEATKLPIDAQPDITNNQVQVITVAPSFGAVDIERLVTFPIEQANSNISGIEEIRSFSRFGLSLVTIVFDDNTDVYWARQQIAERLQQLQSEIPEGIGSPQLGPISTGLGEIYQYVVRPEKGYEDQYDETELRTIQDWIVRRQLLGVKGVADVSSFGGKLKQYEVAVDPNRLQAHSLTITDVFDALENNNQNTGGAYIERGPAVLFIRSEGLIGKAEDIENIAVSFIAGTPIFIKDVAKVTIGFATRYGAMTYNDEGEVSGAIVMMLKGANSNEVIKDIKERIATIQQTLPEGVVIEPFLDRTKIVNSTIKTVKTNLMEGALIVVFILVLFLGNFRAGFLVASIIPLSMLFAVILMNIFGVGGNLMSLGALDFGLIVDGAVIIVEAVMHQLARHTKLGLHERISQREMDTQVSKSATKMANSAVFGQLIILIVYLPILTLEGIEGKMFKPMAQTVAFALIGAFILSLTYIPMMSSLVLNKWKTSSPNFSDRMMACATRLHQRYLIKALGMSKTIIIGVLVLFAGAVFTLSRMGGEFIPSLEEGDFAVETRILAGSNISTTIEHTNKAARILKTQFPEVENVVTKIGSGEIPTEPMPMDAGDMIVVLKPKKEWTSASTFPELSEKMSNALAVLPGVTTGFQFPVQMRFNELMTGARQDVVCKIFGENLDTLALYAQRLAMLIEQVDGAQDLYVEPVTGMPQVVIEYDRAAVARNQLDIVSVNRIVNMAFAGQRTGSVFEGERRFDLVVRLDDRMRTNLEDIHNLLIPTPKGIQIPLHQLAVVDFKNSPHQIQREDAKRRIVVGFNGRGRDVQSIVEELREREQAEISLPPGYYVTYGGAFQNMEEAKKRLGIAVPVSLALIFLLLYFAFGSIKHSLLIYTAIPLSAIGGIYFLALRGMPFSISAGVGFIALFGVAVLNGIVLIAEFNRLNKSGIANTTRIVLIGSRVRLRPVLMTAFVASLGFLPMAISTGSGAEVQRPLATVVIGGLMLATLLTLFLLPILYTLFEKIHLPKWKSRIKKQLIITIGLLILGSSTIAQTPITLTQAIDTALENNLQLKTSTLSTTYYKQLQAGSVNLPPTSVSAEIGQLDGPLLDARIGLSQTLAFPTVYGQQKKVRHAQWEEAIHQRNLDEATLKKTVTEIFYEILVLREKERLLLRADSLYANFVEMANLRFTVGETTVMEKAAAEIQREQIAMQRVLLQNEIEVTLLQLQLILNADIRYDPHAPSLKIDAGEVPQTPLIQTHPVLEYADQRIRTAEAELKLRKSRLLPDITLGYYRQSLRDIRPKWFNIAEVSVGIPVFAKEQKAQIRAGTTQLEISENEYALEVARLSTAYEQVWAKYQTQQRIVNRYETTQLSNIEQIFETAKQQFAAGEIDYLGWVVLTNQAIQLQRDYIEALGQLNQSITQLNYLRSRN